MPIRNAVPLAVRGWQLVPIPRRAGPPLSLFREHHVGTFAVLAPEERRAPVQRDVVHAIVPYCRVYHAIGREGEDDANDTARHDVVPVVRLVDGERTRQEACEQDGQVQDHELPQGRVVVGEDLELRIEV